MGRGEEQPKPKVSLHVVTVMPQEAVCVVAWVPEPEVAVTPSPYIPPPMVNTKAKPRDVLLAMVLDEEVLAPRHLIARYRAAVHYQNTSSINGYWKAFISPDSIRGEPPFGLVVKRVRADL